MNEGKNDGITLIALIITIIILLILAGLSIQILAGENGLIERTVNTKTVTEIGEEKEIINLSANQAKVDVLGANIIKEKLNIALDQNSKESNKARVTDDEDGIFIISFDSQRTYTLDSRTGIIDILERKIDNAPGNIKTGINGETLAGTENSPYEIWSIEDLIEWSIHDSNYIFSFVKLMQDLDFNSNMSYTDGKMLECDSVSELKDKLTNRNGEGFIPIGMFKGVFDGQKHKIENIYINRTGGAALFGGNNGEGQGIIKNLKISGNITSKNNDAAGICLGSGRTVINCINYAKITASRYAGGIMASDMNGVIYNSINNGEITGGAHTGGVVSSTSNSSSEIYNSCNNGKVIGSGFAGGISRDGR